MNGFGYGGRVLVCLLFVMLTAALACAQNNSKLVQSFVEAYVRLDMPAVRQYTPKSTYDFFGPYPFADTPTLKQPKVHKRQALIEFSGKTQSKDVPDSGALLCYKQEDTWKVREVIFYHHAPRMLGLPSRSVTDADKAQEPAVAEVGKAFLNAWQHKDLAKLDALWYNWTHRQDKPVKGLSFSDYSAKETPLNDKESFIHYTAKLTYKWGIFSYSMDLEGGLFVVKEEDAWKVRASVMVYCF